MQPSSSALKLLLCLVFFVSVYSENSWAGRVVKVKGKRVYILLSADEAETFQVGDLLYLTTQGGKKRAITKIRKKKGNKVIAQLGKGNAQKGFLTQLKGAKKKKMMEDSVGYEDAAEVAQEEEVERNRPELLFGLMGGYGNATQKVTTTDGCPGGASACSFDTTGSSLAIKGLIDYALFDDLGVRGRVGLEMFSVEGQNFVSTTPVKTEITYLSIDMLLRYFIVNSSSFGLFVNAGMGIYSPMSKSSEALEAGSISTTSLLIFGAGVSFPLGGMDLFAGVDYNFYPPSDTVETNVLSGKFGLLFEL